MGGAATVVAVAGLQRAHTAAARLSVADAKANAKANANKLTAPHPHPLSLTHAKAKPTATRIYRLEAAQQLPVANLRLTLSWFLLDSAQNLAFLKWTKRHFRLLTLLNRAGLLVGLGALAAPAEIAPFLVFPACMLAVPAPCCSYAMLSVDLVWFLFQHYEFWFFTAANGLTWSMLAALYQDSRVLLLIVVGLDLEQLILLDANFRTFVPAVATCAGAIPALSGLALLVFLRQIELPAHHSVSLRVGELRLGLVEIFLNAVLTLLLFLLRKVYNKRKLLFRRHASSRVVRCMILRCVLQIQPLMTHARLQAAEADPQGMAPLKRAYETSVVLKTLGITAHKIVPSMKAGRVLNARQQLTLVSLRLSTVDVGKTLHLRWCNVQHTVVGATGSVALLYSVGALGLLLSGGSMLIPGEGDANALVHVSRAWSTVVPVGGFLCTLLFCAPFACASQRDLARAMFRNFGFLFPSLQFSLAAVCLADAMRWDARCWATASYCLWFHWILLLDTLTPPARKQLRFHKQLAVPVVLAVWIGMLSVLYAIAVDSPTLRDRVLIHWQLGAHEITTGTKSVLLNRVLTILLWTCRLMWQILHARDAELVLIRGTLDYYCPFDTFTGSTLLGSMKAVVPAAGRVGSTRSRSRSAVLLASTEASISRRKSSLLPMLPTQSRRPSLLGASLPPPSPPDSSLSAALVETDAVERRPRDARVVPWQRGCGSAPTAHDGANVIA